MNTETDYLKSIAEEIAAKKETHPKVDHHLQMEAKRLEKAIIYNLTTIENFTQRDTFHFNTLSKLVNICDILFNIHETITPDVEVLIELLTAIKQVIPDELRPNLKLPKAFIMMQQPAIAASWEQERVLMEQNSIDKGLMTIVGIPFLRFIEHKQTLYWQDFTWLRGYQAKLAIMDWAHADCNSKTEALMSLLIGRDFNDDRFYIYCKKYIEERVARVTGKAKRLLEYALCEKLVLEDTQADMPKFDPRANTLSTRLLKWVSEEIDFVETHEKEVPFTKLRFNLPGYKVAFMFKLLSEFKVFGDTSFKELANQVAATCLSLDGEDIPAKSIIARAYPSDQKTIIEFSGLFDKIGEYLKLFIPKK